MTKGPSGLGHCWHSTDGERSGEKVWKVDSGHGNDWIQRKISVTPLMSTQSWKRHHKDIEELFMR